MMFTRTMSSLIAASALAAAAPALASERGDADDAPRARRCECAAMQTREHDGRAEANGAKPAPDRTEQQRAPRAAEVPLGWDPSWGG